MLDTAIALVGGVVAVSLGERHGRSEGREVDDTLPKKPVDLLIPILINLGINSPP